MQKKKLKTNPNIIKLQTIDFWYWSRYFIDIYPDCPYKCSYCNTQKKSSLNGLDFMEGLPLNKEVIGLGLFSDIYHPEHRKNEFTKSMLELLAKNHYPVNIITKSDAIIDDLEILKNLSDRDHLRVTFTLLTMDEALSLKLEGCSPLPANRLNALKTLRKEGIPCGVAITPIIPCVNDDEESISHIVHESKKMGANWILFSGFNPVDSFLNNPLWKKTAEIHTDQKILKTQYRKIKKFILRLLLRENLPLRVPRITLKSFEHNYYSQIVSEYLFNISYLFELMDREIEMLRYRRAAYRINGIIESLKSIVHHKELGFLKGINPEIENVIEEIIFSNRSTLYTDLYKKIASEV